MKRPSWSTLGKWALLGASLSGIVMAMGTGEEPAQAKKGRAAMREITMTAPRTAETIKRETLAEIAEFERLLNQKQPPDDGEEIGNAFDTISWYAPPPPQPAQPALPQPPAEPVAPPLPFTYLGHFKNQDLPAPVIILGRADRVYTVSEGEVIDDTYRIGPVTAGILELTYLPLNIKQSLKTDVAS